MRKGRLAERARVLWRRRQEEGQGLAEYALILTLVALVCIGALGSLGGAIAGSPGFSLF